ncbi:hypothetical protein ACWDBW_28725 [Streptomyces sp. NPDC001107]
MRELELLGLAVVPLATYYGVARQRRWRILVSALYALVGVLLYANDDMHGWRMAWYLVDLVAMLLILRFLNSPERVDRLVERIWALTPPEESDRTGVEQELHRLSDEPRLRWMCLELDTGGDLLVTTNLNGRSARRRFRVTEECPHCLLEGLLASFVAVEPVAEIEFYRTGTSQGEGYAAYVHFDRSTAGVRIDVAQTSRMVALPVGDCSVHAL